MEEVVRNKIFIYVQDINEAKQLLAHGLVEWLFNQNSKRYRLLTNKLIEVFEEIQYEEKEKISNIFTKLLTH